MNTLQKTIVIIAGVILLACVVAGAAGLVWWVNGGSSTLAAFGSQPVLAAAGGTPTPAATSNAPSTPAGAAATVTPTAAAKKGQTDPKPGAASGSFGIVQSVSGSSIIVTERQQTETINVSPQTLIIYAGKPKASTVDIQAGDKLLAVGPNRQGKLEARAILVAPAAYTDANIIAGQVKTVSNNTITVTTPQGPRTITTDSNTQVYDQMLETEDAANVPTGAAIIAIGQNNGNVLQAQVVLTPPRGTRAGSNNGTKKPTASPTPTK